MPKTDKIKMTSDEYLTKYGDRLFEVHISENNGLKDEHKALNENSWQYDALKKIRQVKTSNQERVYCLESRNAKKIEIQKNLEKINKIINKFFYENQSA